MGEVEQMRMATPGTGKVTTGFVPNPHVERALVHAVDTAQRNLDNYRARACASQPKDGAL